VGGTNGQSGLFCLVYFISHNVSVKTYRGGAMARIYCIIVALFFVLPSVAWTQLPSSRTTCTPLGNTINCTTYQSPNFQPNIVPQPTRPYTGIDFDSLTKNELEFQRLQNEQRRIGLEERRIHALEEQNRLLRKQILRDQIEGSKGD